jgi:hypothetical protein
LIFPKKLAIRAIDQRGYPLEIAGLRFDLMVYRTVDAFWSHRGLGFLVEPTNDRGVTSISIDDINNKLTELRRIYLMDFNTPISSYEDCFSIVLRPDSKIRILHPDSRIRGPSVGGDIEKEIHLPVQDYSLEGIRDSDELSIDFVTCRVDDPFISHKDLLKTIENEDQIDHILSALSARKRIGSYLELYGTPFSNVYDIPFFLRNMYKTSGNILFDYSDQSGASKITIYNPYSSYEMADEIGIYAEKIEAVWAHVPEGLRTQEMMNRIEMIRQKRDANHSLVKSTKVTDWGKRIDKEQFEIDAPSIKINFGSIFPFKHYLE